MYNLQLLFVVLALGVSVAYGQDWAQAGASEIIYNCDAVRTLIAAHGDLEYFRIDDTVFTVEEYHASAIPGCISSSETDTAVKASEVGAQAGKTLASVDPSGSMFQITVDTVINLRACPGTACERLGRARAGDRFDVLGEDGGWYEIAFESGTAYIAAWLTRKIVDPPIGLLADFQFAALSPNDYHSDILHGTTTRRGTHWLNLTHADGSPAAYELQAMNWASSDSAAAYSQPRFFGWGKQDWTALPQLLPESSFYVYLVREQEIHELPISNYSHVDSYNFGFEALERPSGVVAGAQVRILVADSGQSDHIHDWIEAGNKPETVPPPAQPAPPSLSAGDGRISVSIISPPGEASVFSYELGYREDGSGRGIDWTPNISGEGDHTIEYPSNGARYEVTVVAIGRGGRSTQSRFAAIELPKVLASG